MNEEFSYILVAIQHPPLTGTTEMRLPSRTTELDTRCEPGRAPASGEGVSWQARSSSK